MPIEVKKRKGESIGSLIYRFTKRIQQTGVLREAKRRRFKQREPNDTKRKISALHGIQKKIELEKARKFRVL